MKKIIAFVIFNLPLIIYSQITDFSKYKGENIKTYSVATIPDCYFMVYNDSLDRAYSIYKSRDSLQNNTPEELLTSVFSAQNKTWITPYYKGITPDISEKDMNRRSIADSTNYFQFIHKLTFNHNGVQTAIIKYAEYINKVKTGIYSCQVQNVDGAWLFVNVPEILNIEDAIKRVKTYYFNVFVSGGKTDNKDVNELVKNTREQMRVFNISKFAVELNGLDKKNNAIYNILCDN